MLHSEKIKSYNLDGDIAQLDNVIKKIVEIEDKNSEEVESIARLSEIYTGFKVAYNNCPSNLISTMWVEKAQNGFQSINQNLLEFYQGKGSSYLIDANETTLNELLELTVKLNCVRNRQSLRGVQEGFEEYLKITGKIVNQLIEKSNVIVDKYDEVETLVETAKDTFNTRIQEVLDRTDREQQRLDQFAESHERQRAEASENFSNLTNEFREKFLDVQSNNEKKFEEAEKSFREKGEGAITEYKSIFKNYEDEVKNIVGTVNTNMFSHKYKEVANDARKRSIIWNVITMILLVAVVVFAVYAFVITTNSETTWIKLIAKIFATSTIVTGAAYAARQASKQEEREKYARQVEMELVSIDPFIESLNVEQKEKIKEELAFKIFGNEEMLGFSSTKKDENEFSTLNNNVHSILSLLKGAISKIEQ